MMQLTKFIKILDIFSTNIEMALITKYPKSLQIQLKL